MKYLIAILVLALATPLLQGCVASCASFNKSMQNEMGGGLNRKITFYSYDGTPLRSWEGNISTEGEEGTVVHLLDLTTGKRISLSGIYVIEEK